ncbi:cytochrome c-type biogenesis protein CcmF [bacterium BMS3Abin09]|nr:cytochrome c-type biogenesis protein CcmF [bacterium BMS3Abin09]GBE40786.1 cytochrome c-type biogenesis protein CcmF [bacterium BMS3Bbin09]
MIDFGKYSLLFSLILSILVLIGLIIGIRKKDGRFIEMSYRGTKGIFAFMTFACSFLVYAFIMDDFRIEYVASYSEKALPIFYKITGLWAGQKGSLLFWGWLLSLFTFITVQRDEHRVNSLYLPYTLFFLNLTSMFFLVLVNFVTPPFELMAVFPADGNGLNPLLQNPGMVFHPPTLYLGYVGFTVPFAFAMAALVMEDLGEWWIKKTRTWILFSWVCLTLGIIFGGWWAYKELGWGGVWGWDPVENSSFMPWLTATAFLHSVIIQEKRRMLKIWNVSLILLTFSLCIFGTFITRSGIISSVHAFGQSPVGFVFLGFLILVLAAGIYLIWTRYEKLKEQNPRIEAFLSRESSFLYNNIILVGICFATFWGTIFPLISEAVKGVKISVGPPFFNTINAPLFLLLILLMGVCPLLGWRKTSSKGILINCLLPFSLTALSLPVLYISGIRSFMPAFFYSFSVFVITTMLREFYLGTKAGVKNSEKGWLLSFWTLVTRNRRKYGGFIIHIGMVFIVLGLAGYGYFQYKEDAVLNIGQEVTIKNYRLKYLDLTSRTKWNFEGVGARIEVYDSGAFKGYLRPEKRFYKKRENQPTTEVAIMDGIAEDLYLILGDWDRRSGSITLTVVINPLISWIWIGTGVVMFGTFWAVLPKRRRQEDVGLLEKEIILRLKGMEIE